MYRKAAATLIVLGVSSAAGAQSMLECSKLEDEKKRLSCYDRVVGHVEEKLDEEPLGTTEERVEARTKVVTEAIVGNEPNDDVPDLLAVEIKKVMRNRSRRVFYQTTDGRLFRRSSQSVVTFRAGDRCTIETGTFGSLFLVRDDGQKNKVEELSTD